MKEQKNPMKEQKNPRKCEISICKVPLFFFFLKKRRAFMSLVSSESIANVLNLKAERLVFSGCQMLSAQLSLQHPWERPSDTAGCPTAMCSRRGLYICLLELLAVRLMAPKSSLFGVASERCLAHVPRVM